MCFVLCFPFFFTFAQFPFPMTAPMVSIARTRKQFCTQSTPRTLSFRSVKSPRPKKTSTEKEQHCISQSTQGHSSSSCKQRKMFAVKSVSPFGWTNAMSTNNSSFNGEKSHTVKCIVPFRCPVERRDASAANAVRDNCDNASLRDFMMESSCSFGGE